MVNLSYPSSKPKNQVPNSHQPFASRFASTLWETPQTNPWKSLIFHPAKSGSLWQKKKVSSLSEALRGEWQTMMGAFPSVCGRGTQIVSTSTCLRFSFKNHRNKLRTPRTDWRWKTIRQSFEISLIWKMWICWSATKKWTRSQIPQENEIPQENGGSKHLVYQDSIMPLKFVVQSGKIIHHHESSWIITHHKS